MSHVFISYVHENRAAVDRLAKELRDNGVTVWLDRDDIEPGADWKDAIKKAIQSGKFFIACFSKESDERDRTYMREEITLAIDELRLRPKERKWFIPLLINSTNIPSLRISSAYYLSDIQSVNLYEDWNNGVTRILRVLEYDNPNLSRVWNLIDIIRTPFDEERLHAVEQLRAMGALARPAVDALIEASKDNNLQIKRASIEALGQIGPPAVEAVPALVAALGDRDQDVRQRATRALKNIGPTAVVPALAAALGDPERVVRRRAADALGQIGPPAVEAVPALVAALGDRDQDVRQRAADALGQIGLPAVEAVPALVGPN